MVESSHNPLKAAVGKAKYTCPVLLAYPYTPPAENTFIGVIDKERVTIIYRELPHKALKTPCFKLGPQVMGYFLKLAGAVLGTMGTVHRVRSHNQLKSAAGQP